MLTGRINLKTTVNDELLFSALIERVEKYVVNLNGLRKIIKLNSKGKGSVNYDIAELGDLLDIKISPGDIKVGASNMRVNIFISPDNDDVLSIVIATVENPYRVATENTVKGRNRYIIKHGNDNVPINNGASEFSEITSFEHTK